MGFERKIETKRQPLQKYPTRQDLENWINEYDAKYIGGGYPFNNLDPLTDGTLRVQSIDRTLEALTVITKLPQAKV